MNVDTNEFSARALAAGIRCGAFTAQAVTESTLDRTAALNPAINAIVQDCTEEALEAASQIDAQIKAGTDPGPLAGVPVTIKVISDQKGFASTNGTKLARDAVADTDSPFVRNLRESGAVIIGRTNTPAFSYRWFTSNQMHGTTLNPRNDALTPGGSSGGAGSATATGLGHIAHGTDIAGSIRYPAYACGVQGLRPTFGRVPMFNGTSGDRAVGPQLMAVSGPLARRVDDLRLGLQGMAGYAPEDPWSAPVPLTGAPVPRRAALVPRPGGIDTDPRILADLDRAAALLRAAGWEVEITNPPELREAVELQIDMWLSDGFEDKLAAAEAEADPGALALLHHYEARARSLTKDSFAALFPARARLIRAWRAFLQDYPLVLMPVSARLPFLQDEDLTGDAALSAIWEAQLPQIAIPLLGLPALSVFSGLEDQVPCGVQLVSAPWREDVALAAGDVLESGFGVPPLA